MCISFHEREGGCLKGNCVPKVRGTSTSWATKARVKKAASITISQKRWSEGGEVQKKGPVQVPALYASTKGLRSRAKPKDAAGHKKGTHRNACHRCQEIHGF